MTDRFTTLADVRLERDRLRFERDRSLERLDLRWRALKDREVRGALMNDALKDAIRAWKPLHTLGSLFGGGSLGTALGVSLGRRGGLGKRLFLFALTLALPKLLQRFGDLSVEKLVEQARTTIDRIRERIQERRAERTAHTDDEA